MKIAFLYAGQGSQHVGMGRDLYEAYPAFRQVLDNAPVDFDLKKLSFEGPEEQLGDTRYTQPCMVAFAAGVTALLREAGITPDYTAGLSLGEYSALHCAGVFDAQTAISLVAFRGQAMAQAVRDAERFQDGAPTVFHRRNRSGWLVTQRLEDWIALYRKKEPPASHTDSDTSG